jgi:hypothetical protein
MTKHYAGEPPSAPIDGTDHRSVLALLPEYVSIRVLEQQPPPDWDVLEQHLLQCEMCRSESEALFRLVSETYAGTLSRMAAAPAPDLTFLNRRDTASNYQRITGGLQLMQAKEPRPVVFQFSAALLPRMRVQMVARARSLRLLYSHEIPSSNDVDPTITIEVYVADDDPDRGLVRVCVEFPDRSPFDQAGSLVTLHDGYANWSAITNQNGVVTFTDVPLSQIERWQTTVTPPEARPPDD